MLKQFQGNPGWIDSQYGLEKTPELYIGNMVMVFRNELGHGQRPDQKNHEYLKDKDLAGMPWRLALALQADGWYLRSDIIWHKPNPMPESVTDRPTKSHEYIFLMTKKPKYFYDVDAVREPQQQFFIDMKLRNEYN